MGTLLENSPAITGDKLLKTTMTRVNELKSSWLKCTTS